jgi:hypothetical protein
MSCVYIDIEDISVQAQARQVQLVCMNRASNFKGSLSSVQPISLY